MVSESSANALPLDALIAKQAAAFRDALLPQHANLFSPAVVCVSAERMTQMQAVIAAVEEAVNAGQGEVGRERDTQCLGVFYGYDFHLNDDGTHLIEINTNAGGAFLNALLHDQAALEAEFLAMFRNEWRLARGDAPLHCVAIVDEAPQSQYLYPEFLLAQAMLQRAGITALIAAPDELLARDGALYAGQHKVDLIYNRLTDFSLQQFPHLLAAYQNRQTVFTPNPAHYQRYADKRKLAALSDEQELRAGKISPASVDALLRGVPQTKIVDAKNAETWWSERKHWFFKPVQGYGSKGAYRGDKLTRRVFEDIMQSDYVAQRLAMPGECAVRAADGTVQTLKYDVRCYVYDGKIQLIAARLYQGQTTNFRTAGGGFAAVRVVE